MNNGIVVNKIVDGERYLKNKSWIISDRKLEGSGRDNRKPSEIPSRAASDWAMIDHTIITNKIKRDNRNLPENLFTEKS